MNHLEISFQKMKYQIVSTLESEYKRILFTASGIKNNIYQELGFLILPKLNKKLASNQVIFPYSAQLEKTFWKKVSALKYHNLNYKMSKNDLQFVSYYFPNIPVLEKKYLKKIENQINSQKNKFLETVVSIFGDSRQINEVKIYITNYGTGASYIHIDKEKSINIYLRKDRPVEIAFAQIVNAIVHTDLQKQPRKNHIIDQTWKNKNIIVGYLYQNTPLKQLYLEEKTLNHTLQNKIPFDLSLQSQSYLRKLGFQVQPVLTLENNNLFNHITQTRLDFLTFEEEKVLKFLITNKNKIVTFAEIGDVIWGKESPQKYSLYAISRIIFEIRSKLKANGINKEIIQTQRKKGYYLQD